MKLNLGCGKDRIEGFVNVDMLGGQIKADACNLPFKDESFDFALASHVLEHIPNLRRAMLELFRVLRPNGLLRIYVPYGVKSMYNPFHVRAFDLTTMDYFTWKHESSLEADNLFTKQEARISCYALPFSYHIEKYGGIFYEILVRLGIFESDRPGRLFGWRLPLTPRTEIALLLEKTI